MAFVVHVTKRVRHRKLRLGGVAHYTRYVLNYRDPRTGARKQLFFERQKDAQRKASDITASVTKGTYAPERKPPTVKEAVDAWLKDRDGNVKKRTLAGYRHVARAITEPLLIGTTPKQRAEHTVTGKLPNGTRLEPLLGSLKVTDLTTAEIRSWHRLVTKEIGVFTANRAKQYLTAALTLAAEDHHLRPPAIPSNLGRGPIREKKAILTTEQVARVIAAARGDGDKGLYYAFPFLAGTRVSEQLALAWSDIDFERSLIRVHRMQEMTGSVTNLTKTAAGTREIPMCATLREMLLAWRVRCPRKAGELHRVFPGLGQRQAWPKPRVGGGGGLNYHNFRSRIWAPALKRLGLPYVTPHSARHSFISVLQAQGVEVGLVAKLAGHANATVTLSHYTQAVRGGAEALEALERAYASA